MPKKSICLTCVKYHKGCKFESYLHATVTKCDDYDASGAPQIASEHRKIKKDTHRQGIDKPKSG